MNFGHFDHLHITVVVQVYIWYSLPPEERVMMNLNPMCEVFPRIASCDYVRFGSGGHQEKKNALCILGLNMINDKIFLIIWYWYIILLIIGTYRLLFRAATMLSWQLRSPASTDMIIFIIVYIQIPADQVEDQKIL